MSKIANFMVAEATDSRITIKNIPVGRTKALEIIKHNGGAFLLTLDVNFAPEGLSTMTLYLTPASQWISVQVHEPGKDIYVPDMEPKDIVDSPELPEGHPGLDEHQKTLQKKALDAMKKKVQESRKKVVDESELDIMTKKVEEEQLPTKVTQKGPVKRKRKDA